METPWREQHASGISDDESWLHPLPCSGSFNVISQIPWLGAKGQIVARFLVVAAAMLMVRGKVPGFERRGCLLVCRPNEKGEASVQPATRCRWRGARHCTESMDYYRTDSLRHASCQDDNHGNDRRETWLLLRFRHHHHHYGIIDGVFVFVEVTSRSPVGVGGKTSGSAAVAQTKEAARLVYDCLRATVWYGVWHLRQHLARSEFSFSLQYPLLRDIHTNVSRESLQTRTRRLPTTRNTNTDHWRWYGTIIS